MLPPTPPASPKPSGVCTPEDRLGLVLAGRIELTSILGVGAYGTVYKARDLETNVQYAVKALNKIGLDPRQKEFQKREIQLHYQASQHPNVVSLVKIMETADCTFVVIEFCPEGDLFAKITEEGQYVGNDLLAKHVFLQILDAVEYCHSVGVYHRDLKPENILVSNNGNTVKLADFGLATMEGVTSDFGCGSTFYMSPECQQPNPKPFASYASVPNDIWSLGVILVNLTCGRNPWKRACASDPTFSKFLRDRSFLQSILPITDELNCILQRIFEVDPRHRISLPRLRELILRCRSLSQHTSVCSAPPTPPYSPIQEAADYPVNVYCEIAKAIPAMDLPGQRYPSPNQSYGTQQPWPVYPATPPHSIPVSPVHTSYTFAAPQATPTTAAPIVSQAAFVSSGPMWSRCSQLLPALNMPRPACFWNMPTY